MPATGWGTLYISSLNDFFLISTINLYYDTYNYSYIIIEVDRNYITFEKPIELSELQIGIQVFIKAKSMIIQP